MKNEPFILRDLFFKHVAQTSSLPLGLEIREAKGVYLYSADGRKFLDLISGVSVSNLGHGNKEVAEAVKRQIDKYAHIMVYGEMIESPQVEHASLLASILPPSLNSVYYVNSGSEANEGAVKLAKRVTGRREVLSCNNCYHGSSQGCLSLMSSEEFKRPFRPLLPMIGHIRFNSTEDLCLITDKTACVIIEPVQGEGGVQIPKPGYLAALRKKCDETGAFLIYDEVQTGFGRTGKMFAFEKYDGVVPDILTLAKALGGGMPMGAFVASGELMKAWQSDPPLGHITTFGGHPVCCAAALASLRYMLAHKKELVDDAERKSALFVDGLKDHPLVKEIRAAGLLIAVDLHDCDKAKKILYLLLDEGVITDWFLFQPTSFRIAPPLIISDSEIVYAVKKIREALDKLA
ncbi:MAG: aspartate aminotransferase family protein [Bacteroidales bacterium]|jgi:acetylornithine/succinyldiaminopimelate/putrescine aminotransferase|nr:aspartate aminotransferase family protein [Bacteroidales bacterium]